MAAFLLHMFFRILQNMRNSFVCIPTYVLGNNLSKREAAMGTPTIPKNSATAQALAQTLGTTAEVLYQLASAGSDLISVHSLALKEYHGRIISLGGILDNPGRCSSVFVVDDGDGMVGVGDLVLDGYGSCAKNHPTMGFARLFGDNTNFQCSDDDQVQNSAPNDIVEKLSAFQGRQWRSIISETRKKELEKICSSKK